MGVLFARVALVASVIVAAASSHVVQADPVYYDKSTCTRDWEPAKANAMPAVAAFGNARLNVYVNVRGTVDRVELVEGDPRSALVKQLLAAAPKMKFTPARCDGKVVDELDHLSYRIPLRPLASPSP